MLIKTRGKDSGPLQTNVGVPIFIIDSQEWSGQPTNLYGQEHFDVVKSIAQNSLNKTKGAWFATLCMALLQQTRLR